MSVRFKLDENVPRDAVDLFRDAGHSVHTVFDERLGGETDSRIFEACQREERILVTFDLDFADIRRYPPATHAGVWVLRPPIQDVKSTLSLLKGAFVVLASEPASKRLWIIGRERIRIRK